MSSQKLKKTAHVDDAALNLIIILIVASLLLIVVSTVYFATTRLASASPEGEDPENVPAGSNADYPFNVHIDAPVFNTDDALTISDTISSEHAIIVDVTDNKVLASRLSRQMIYPASMTKVMTLIVAVENLKTESSLDDVITISKPQGDHSGYGLKVGEQLTVKDLLYVAILQSDGIACLELADYIAGSEANFVKLMNDKAAELGISSSTLFQNCSGLHHQYQYTTVYDMSVIMSYAMKNPLCASVLTSLSYKPSENFRPGEGCTFWHKLLHNYLDDGNTNPKNATLLGGKTGFTEKNTSGYCIVSYAKGDNGHFYVTVTAKAEGWMANVDDILYIFNNHVK